MSEVVLAGNGKRDCQADLSVQSLETDSGGLPYWSEATKPSVSTMPPLRPTSLMLGISMPMKLCTKAMKVFVCDS